MQTLHAVVRMEATFLKPVLQLWVVLVAVRVQDFVGDQVVLFSVSHQTVMEIGCLKALLILSIVTREHFFALVD